MQTRILVQNADFDLSAEYARLSGQGAVGAVVAFVGLVRELNHGESVRGMSLEHYPGMTETALTRIVARAGERWPLSAVTVIHRIGDLYPRDQIVLVLTASAHRHAAYQANQFIMDILKTEAPFWKSEITPNGRVWVDARENDAVARQRWESDEI